MENPFEVLMAKLLEIESKVDSLLGEKYEVKDDGLLTKKEAANYLRVSLSTLTNLVNSGQLIKSNIGRNPKFRKSNLDSFLKEN